MFVETTLETAILLALLTLETVELTAFELILEACELLITTELLILYDTDPL